MPDPNSSRGQAVPLVLVVLLFAAACAGGLVRVAVAAVQRAEAQAAADAVALAGAASDRQGAAEVAEANDTELVRYDVDGDEVLVTVARAGVTARARARWVPAPIP